MEKLEKEMLSIKEASKFLNLKESWIRSAVFRKEMPFTKLGHLIRFSMNDLTKWLEGNKRLAKGDKHGRH